MPSRKQFSFIAIFVVILITISGLISNWVSAYSPDYYHEIQKNIELFGRVYQEISKKYVEEVDPTEFMRAGINGMLATLDPYTVLVEKEDNAELQIMSSGKYGGLGMRIGLRSNWPTVVEPPFAGTPALKAGIREGDKIIEVDGTSTKGKSISEVANMLRGEIGSEVFLKIMREGEEEPIEFRLIRAEIVVTDVVYTGMIQDGMGYIRLRHFSRNAGKDIERAIRDLKKQGLEGLILDLRSNPGGLLEAAVSVSENFIEKGKPIVSTEGRVKGSVQEYHSERDPVLEGLPLIVLVNGYSASASEIVAGAVQDLDRGVIVGSNTFGKGLVQTVVPITGEAALKITTAKYLIPSGRSIQDPTKYLRDSDGHNVLLDDEEHLNNGRNGQSENEAERKEKQQKVYHTAGGRKVYASHGITPDVIVKEDTLRSFEMQLLRKTMPFQFAVVYAAQHPELSKDFKVTQQMLQEFEKFLEEKEFEYKSEVEDALHEIEKVAKGNNYYASIATSIEDLRTEILAQKAREFERSTHFIEEQLEREISAKLWGTKAEIEAGFDSDDAIQKAIAILSDTSRYHAILSVGETKIEQQ